MCAYVPDDRAIRLQDIGDPDDDLEDDSDDEFEDDEDEDDSDDEDDESEEETWQVSRSFLPLKVGLGLTSGDELPRLSAISQLSYSWRQLGRIRPEGSAFRSQAPVTG